MRVRFPLPALLFLKKIERGLMVRGLNETPMKSVRPRYFFPDESSAVASCGEALATAGRIR